MLTIALTMLGILVLAAIVAVYVAFPHRGHDLPAVPWVGEAMKKSASVLPTIEETEDSNFRLWPGGDPAHDVPTRR